MSINPTVPIKTEIYPSTPPIAARPMDKAWRGFFAACAQGLVRLDEHDVLIGSLDNDGGSHPSITKGTHATRVAQPPSQDFSLFYETDRTAWYMAQGGVWIYWAGTYSDVLANIPLDLSNASDTGFQFYATNFAHEWYWASSTYHFQPWESSGYIVPVYSTGAPTGGVWHACDGSSVSIAKATGANSGALVQTVTLPDLRGNVAVLGGTLARTAATAYLTQSVQPWDGIAVAVDVPQAHIAPDETNGGMPLRIGLTFFVRQ